MAVFSLIMSPFLYFPILRLKNYFLWVLFARGGHKSDLASSSRCWGRGTRWGRGPPGPWSAWCGRAWLLLLLVTLRGGVGESLRMRNNETLSYTSTLLNYTNLRFHFLYFRSMPWTNAILFPQKTGRFFVVLFFTSKSTRFPQKARSIRNFFSFLKGLISTCMCYDKFFHIGSVQNKYNKILDRKVLFKSVLTMAAFLSYLFSSNDNKKFKRTISIIKKTKFPY